MPPLVPFLIVFIITSFFLEQEKTEKKKTPKSMGKKLPRALKFSHGPNPNITLKFIRPEIVRT